MPAMTERTTLDMLGRRDATPLAAALTVLRDSLANAAPPADEEIELAAALERYLAADLYAPQDLPNHPRSVMDGYAVRAADTYGASSQLPAYLKVSGEVRMGEMPTGAPAVGECFRIATGGLLPAGCDAVVMLEHTVAGTGGLLEVVKPVAAGGNVIACGDDVRVRELLLPAGHRLRPCDLGLLAGLGLARLTVYRRPLVGIISTGDEIVPPEQTPPPGKIRDMNMQTIAALVTEQGGQAQRLGIVGDDEPAFSRLLEQALAQCDLVLFSGGSSVGVGDLGERVLKRLTEPGILLHGVAIKPGKPVIIARHGRVPVFGLPGHPVSAAAAYALFVRPTLELLAGHHQPAWHPRPAGRAILERSLNSAAGRTDLIPVMISEARDTPDQPPTVAGDDCLPRATPVLGKSSALSTLVRARAWIMIAAHQQGLAAGSPVDYYLI